MDQIDAKCRVRSASNLFQQNVRKTENQDTFQDKAKFLDGVQKVDSKWPVMNEMLNFSMSMGNGKRLMSDYHELVNDEILCCVVFDLIKIGNACKRMIWGMLYQK